MWVETATSVKAAGQSVTVEAATIPVAALMDVAVLGEATTEQDAATFEKESRDHVIVSSGWWPRQAGRAEGGGSGTRS